MSLNRRAALAQITFLSLSLATAAWAGHVVDNSMGRFDAVYKGDVRVTEPGKEPRTFKSVKFELQGRYMTIFLPDVDPVKARCDQIYTTGYKTEISGHQTESGRRFFITASGQIGE